MQLDFVIIVINRRKVVLVKNYQRKTQVFFYDKSLGNPKLLMQSFQKISSLPSLRQGSKLHYFRDEYLLCEHLQSIIARRPSQILLLDLEEKKDRVDKALKEIQSHKVFKDLSTDILKGEIQSLEGSLLSPNGKTPSLIYSLKPFTHTIQVFPFFSLMKRVQSLEEYWWMNFEFPRLSCFYSKEV